MTRVVLGNHHAIHSRDHGETYEAMPKGKRATEIPFNEDTPLAERFQIVTNPGGAWDKNAVEGSKPAWVAGDDPALVQLLASHYGVKTRDLDDPYAGRFPAWAATSMVVVMLAMLLAKVSLFLKVNTGNDFQYQQMAGSASATAVGKWVGITANTTAPGPTDTTLTGEIATAGGGLIRKAGTPAHTTGAASYTITTVFTANGSDSLPVTVGKRGIFDALTSGNLIFESLVSPTATLSAVGDALTLTDTISM